jgi:hypothetical protein
VWYLETDQGRHVVVRYNSTIWEMGNKCVARGGQLVWCTPGCVARHAGVRGHRWGRSQPLPQPRPQHAHAPTRNHRFLQAALDVKFNALKLGYALAETPSWQYIALNGLTSLFGGYTWSLDVIVDFAWYAFVWACARVHCDGGTAALRGVLRLLRSSVRRLCALCLRGVDTTAA